MIKKCILCFVKTPYAGYSKTRLAKTIGEENAEKIYCCMLEDVLGAVRASEEEAIIFYYPESSLKTIKQICGKEFTYCPQNGDNLGQRMENAFRKVFKEYDKAVLIGSDIASLNSALLQCAFKRLNTSGCVIGPSFDGGYYLLGFRKEAFNTQVFKNISWSSNKVFKQTIDILKKEKIEFTKLPKLIDIDNISSLKEFHRENKNKKLKTAEFINKLFESKRGVKL